MSSGGKEVRTCPSTPVDEHKEKEKKEKGEITDSAACLFVIKVVQPRKHPADMQRGTRLQAFNVSLA